MEEESLAKSFSGNALLDDVMLSKVESGAKRSSPSSVY